MCILITKKLLKNAFFSIFKAHFHQNFQQKKIKIDAPFQLVYGFGGQPQPPNEPELGPPGHRDVVKLLYGAHRHTKQQ